MKTTTTKKTNNTDRLRFAKNCNIWSTREKATVMDFQELINLSTLMYLDSFQKLSVVVVVVACASRSA